MINRNLIIKKIILIFFIIIFFIILYSFKPLQSVIQKAFASFSIDFSLKQATDLQTEISGLKDQLSMITIDEARIQALEEENKKLRGYLSFFETKDLNYVLSNVVARQSFLGINSQEQNLIIDKGRQDGISEGLAVLSELGSIVGKIVEVKESSSLVCLFNNRNCQLAVSILNQDRTLGLTEGEKGLSIKMSLIPQTEEINVNDIVVSSGLDNLIPRGLTLGRIYQIERKGNDIWQSAIIEPVVVFDDLSILAIVLP